jgi:hypothetical protein
MIARAAGDKTKARDYLRRALVLNPQFDLLQALPGKLLKSFLEAVKHNKPSARILNFQTAS